MTKIHGAYTLFEEFDLKLLGILMLTFVLDFATAFTFLLWVLRSQCTKCYSKRRQVKGCLHDEN